MTVNNNGSQLTSYQSITYSSFRINVVSANSQASTSPATAASQPADTVSLSPEATSQAAANTTDSTTAAPQTTTFSAVATQVSATYVSSTSTSSTNSAQGDDAASALFNALDADQDGSVTEDEFKAGAKALLRQGRRGNHPEGVRHGEHDHRGGRRLDRTLGRLFDAVNANGDGNITKDELSSALGKTSQSTQGGVQDPPPPSEPLSPLADPAGANGNSTTTSASYFSVTVVSVAIRSYTALSPTNANNSNSTQPSTTSTPADAQKLPLAA
ncbi:MAG: EF-hand domain-containing protein [Vicinamibacterales bacterium]